MKKTNLRFDHFITLVEEGRLKVGRYEYERNVDAQGDSHFYRYYRKRGQNRFRRGYAIQLIERISKEL